WRRHMELDAPFGMRGGGKAETSLPRDEALCGGRQSSAEFPPMLSLEYLENEMPLLEWWGKAPNSLPREEALCGGQSSAEFPPVENYMHLLASRVAPCIKHSVRGRELHIVDF
ncbi:hypothetical protein, partial [Candidatus Ichthyocystis sparus]|uniref:hypothetical protein n=1 Tax=Candidatus Ichthyocystis sparus TaxID=1561004 RepID=UPI001F5FED4E